jgi:hypothetical protein
MITYALTLQTIASFTGIATSTSMIIAYRQLRLASRNSQLSFEDALAREFRQVANRIPFAAVLGGEISDAEFKEALPAFYMYFDLSDEQVFQRRHGRVSDLTWANWAEGIRDTVSRPAFARALEHILAQRSDAFSDLRRFLDEGGDPEEWPRTLAEAVTATSRAAGLRRAAPGAGESERFGRIGGSHAERSSPAGAVS